MAAKPKKQATAEAEGAQQNETDGAAAAAAVGEAITDAVENGTLAAVQPTPPAPGEDAESVFDRRVERLGRIVEEADFDSGTALGDLRDCLIEVFKHRPKLWSAMTPSEQGDLSRHLQGVAKTVLRKVVTVIAQEESLTVDGVVAPQWSVKGDAIELKVKIDHVDGEVMMDVYKLAGHAVCIVSADDKRFASQRRDLPPADDQIKMAFADDAPAKPPADDSDLNPDDDDDAGNAGDDNDDEAAEIAAEERAHEAADLDDEGALLKIEDAADDFPPN